MMWQKNTSRREFADLMQGRRLTRSDSLYQFDGDRLRYSTVPDEIGLIWAHDPRETRAMPGVAIIAQDQQRDTLAWFASYVPVMRPLTAFCRVVDPSIAETFLSLPAPSLGAFNEVCVSLILTELATIVGGKREALEASVNACQATLSFAISRAAALGLPDQVSSELPGKWAQARVLLGSAPSSQQLAALARVWSVVAALAKRDYLFERQPLFPQLETPPTMIVEACRDLLRGKELDLNVWRDLFRDIPDSRSLISGLTGPREGRVALLEAALAHLRDYPNSNRDTTGFTLGYLASAVGPGTLDHIQLLIPLLKSFPDVLLWYGLLAGLSSKGSLGKNADGLARRLSRELLRDSDIASAPVCDIAFEELQMQSTSSREWLDIRESVAGNLSVELFPSVNSIHRFSRTGETVGGKEPDSQPSLNEKLLYEIDESLHRLNRSFEKLKSDAFNRSGRQIDEQPPRRRIRKL
jgi:hypothetical protein